MCCGCGNEHVYRYSSESHKSVLIVKGNRYYIGFPLDITDEKIIARWGAPVQDFPECRGYGPILVPKTQKINILCGGIRLKMIKNFGEKGGASYDAYCVDRVYCSKAILNKKVYKIIFDVNGSVDEIIFDPNTHNSESWKRVSTHAIHINPVYGGSALNSFGIGPASPAGCCG